MPLGELRTDDEGRLIVLGGFGQSGSVPDDQPLPSFADNDVLDVPGKPRAVHTPGHTPGNAALYFQDQDAVISGDTLITHNPLTGRTGPQVMPSGFNRDTAQALASLSALENLNVETIFPAHGDPWHGPIGQAVQLARAAGPS